MALRYTVGFARRDPIGLVTVNRTSGPAARLQRFPAEAGSVLRRHRFGADMPFRPGVEEELPLADRQSLALAPVTERGLTTAPSSAAHLKGELSDGVIELATEIVAGDSDAVAHPDRAA
jgi:hypothetical protein